VLDNPASPVLAIIGGSKVSTKIGVLKNLVHKVDAIVIGGAMANTFLAAKGVGIGRSLYEADYIAAANEIITVANKVGCEILLPQDVTVADQFGQNIGTQIVPCDRVGEEKMILDIGAEAIIDIAAHVREAKTIIWNGPLGAFEYSPFDVGTLAVVRMVASRTRAGKLVSVAGGGDILAAVNKAGLAEDFSYISTAGGAFLEWLEGAELPAIAALV